MIMVGTAPQRPRTAATNQEFIRDAVKAYILDHNLASGDPLPTEQELMSQLGVGRHPLREAMKALQAVGIIEIRHGYGTYVGAVGLKSLEDGLAFRMSQSMTGDLREVRDVLAVRQALEIGLADEVVAHFGPGGLDELTEIVERMEAKADQGETFADEDWEFHRALYQPLGNDLIMDLLAVFWRTFADVNARLPGDSYPRETAARWHRDLLTALESGDAARFAAAMKDHFVGIRTRFER
ncbi:FadR/GntR family transcriptional regulator [Microlunatus speluncae]|uniref:FadR/GntR family transcriptional regulator n=1 Tax=Microlunatus speluncae TaxID=2594267 RepID=UPI001FE9B542|nr:FadR/GntR family transcriptional regulator [Microlunatus speluncae]